tara:strand:- start:525 stop:917 length:393 start_codon:yes stop_codon:yes gene_type:complete
MKEKDWDYIASLEKAIAKKYGDVAIKNPASNWDQEKEEEYLKQIKEMREQESVKESSKEMVATGGFFTSKKLINRETNRQCPLCGIYSFRSRDELYMNKFKCCYKCYIKHFEGIEHVWENKWKRIKSNVK